MAANIVSSPRRAGGSIMAAPAPPGCWRAWRSYSGFQPWPAGGRQIWCVSTTLCRMLCDSGWRSVADIPLVAYATLTLSGFVLAFCHPGHSKLPIVCLGCA
ncbi:Uncharacterised protein [Klebsiella pneumoniae]|nr:Uncharacterised protein [Klebsiella pneumoniae]